MPPLARLQWLIRLRSLLAIGCFALPAYWAWSFSGPFRWLTRGEQWLFNADHGLINYLLCVLALLVLLLLPLAIQIQRFCRHHQLEDELQQRQQQQARAGRRAHGWVLRHPLLIIGLTLLLIGGGIGVDFWWRGRHAGPPQPLQWSDLQQGTVDAGSRVAITGYADTRRYWVSERLGLRSYWVIVHPAGGADPSIRLFAQVADPTDVRRLADAGTDTWVGILETSPGGRLLDELRQTGLPLADTLWVLDMRDTPAGSRTLGLVFLSLFGGSGGLCLALDGWLHRRRRKGHA